jgi:hypothetical protein
MVFGEESDLDLSEAEILNPEYETNPRVHYTGLPKRFIAGTVYDSVNEEVVTGATCTLAGTGTSLTATTNSWGDFWFNDLDEDTFTLTIQADGFSTKKIESISTVDGDIGLGDIDLA